MAEIKLSPTESFSIILEKYKKDLEKEIRALEKKRPKSPVAGTCKKVTKYLTALVEAEVKNLINKKYPGILKNVEAIDPNYGIECWENQLHHDMGFGSVLEIPSEVYINVRHKKSHDNLEFTTEIPYSDVFKAIQKEAEEFCPIDNKYQDGMDTLVHELKRAQKDSPDFRLELKKKLLKASPEGKKILGELSKINLAKTLRKEMKA